MPQWFFIPQAEYHKDVRLRAGREVYNKSTVDDWALARSLGSLEEVSLEETNVFQTDSRDLAADREAEEHLDNFDVYGEEKVSSVDELFKGNEKLARC